jgi:hypothetical protein
MSYENAQAGRWKSGEEARAGTGGNGAGLASDRAQAEEEAEAQEGSAQGAGSLTRRRLLLGCCPFFGRRETALSGVRFHVIRNGDSARRYLLIHGNEETARQVLTAHLARHPGIAHLVMNRSRNVLIDAWYIDPNRMFSREGASRSLARLNVTYPARLLDYLDRERPKLLKALLPPAGGLLVALHNNSATYSVRDELANSDEVSLKPGESPHNFFLCTQMADYEILAKSPYNAVLQNKAPKIDDGSLSRLAARMGVRYVNLEVSLGMPDQQREMLEWLERNL